MFVKDVFLNEKVKLIALIQRILIKNINLNIWILILSLILGFPIYFSILSSQTLILMKTVITLLGEICVIIYILSLFVLFQGFIFLIINYINDNINIFSEQKENFTIDDNNVDSCDGFSCDETCDNENH